MLTEKLERCQRDYGAIYFFIKLFLLIEDWPEDSINTITKFSLSALGSDWPDFMKFKPIAIITIVKFNPCKYLDLIISHLDHEKSPFWASRYAALVALEKYYYPQNVDQVEILVEQGLQDKNRLVRAKALEILSR